MRGMFLEDLHVQVAEPHCPAGRVVRIRADEGADEQRDHPGRQRGDQRPAQPDDEVLEVGARAAGLRLQQDLPVPVVVHVPFRT
jgi:hypothetical protein